MIIEPRLGSDFGRFALQAVGRRRSTTEGVGCEATSDFLRGVVLVGDLQVKTHMLPEEVSVGISNASHFGKQFLSWP